MNKFKKHIAYFMVFTLLFMASMIPAVRIDAYAVGLPEKTTVKDKGKDVAEKAKEKAGKAKDKASEKGKEAVKKGKEVANKGKDAAVQTGKHVASKIKVWYSNIDKDTFEKGWKRAADVASSEMASNVGKKYINSVRKEIEKFGTDINASKGSARGVAQEAGYIAEKWHADTFNIDSVAASSSSKAIVPGSNEFGSQ